MSKTTRIDVMRKSVEGKEGKELIALCAKYFNELANRFFFEYEEVTYDEEHNVYRESEKPEENFYSTINEFCGEICYWLSCYYESGHVRHDEEYGDRLSFIKFLKVFVPLCSDKPVNLGFTRWIPRMTETQFLF